jgi:tetratricopeptide (TPR) repeat protein
VNIALIRLYQTSGDLEQAERQIAAADMNRTTRREHSVLLDEKGDVKRASGDSQGALADYREGLKISRALAEDDPANAEHRSDLSVSLIKIGAIHQQLGNFSEALASYRTSLPLAKQLAQTDPSNVRFQQVLKITERLISELESPSNQ